MSNQLIVITANKFGTVVIDPKLMAAGWAVASYNANRPLAENTHAAPED